VNDAIRWGYDLSSWQGILVAVLCVASFVLFATALVLAGFRHTRALRRFGDPALVQTLQSFDATARRSVKAVLLLAAMAMSLLALARPKFGSGTRLIPATNLDIVVVLDYSKSMYARDVAPSRIERAKAEVGRLIRDLPGARFGAVAFAGEPMSFPLTSDGAAIAQFFRQLNPNDMPVGGTATARALERAREIFARDPKSKDHVRVIVLVTDGEDLEGDPVEVAKACAAEGTRIDVVQIGGRAPEVIPEVGPDGKVLGVRKDDSGKPLTTELSAEGEAQLASVAQTANGTIVRAEHGETGIDTVAKQLSKMMREELSEKVETVYDEEYAWPLGIAFALFVAEAFLSESPVRKRKTEPPKKRRGTKLGRRREARELVPKGKQALVAVASLAALALAACSLDAPFDRDAPQVKQAIAELDAGDAAAAAADLEAYLATGACAEGNIGAPPILKERPNGTFDLGLSLFRIGEAFGRRFGEEEIDGGVDDQTIEKRHGQIDCALRVVRVVSTDESAPIDLRARAKYLEGNLLFLERKYEDAVHAYDEALELAPGQVDAGDPVGRDAAWNRSIALRRIDDEKDASKDSSDDAPHDASPDAPKDSGEDAAKDSGGDSGGQDSGKDSGGEDSGGNDAGQDAAPPPPPDGGAPPPPTETQDDRILDQLEQAPLLQEEAAKRQAQKRHVRGMADK
jgi:Ca-activated chloride channel family protein